MPCRAYSLGKLVELLGGELVGDPDTLVDRVATLASAGARDISFYHRASYSAELASTQAGAIVLGAADSDTTTLPRIVADNPYLYFARVSALLNPREAPPPGTHPSAVVASDAIVSPGASIGPLTVIEHGARIEEGASVGACCSIGERCRIGPGTLMHARVTLYRDTRIGARCILHSGCVIGADGFGFAPDRGAWFKIPQIGGVLIGDDVEIGANTTIDRGALDDTVIEDGVKLDNQVQIGHNCRIGKHSAIAGCVGIAGSTVIGAHCMVGGAAGISGHLTIADRVVVSAGSTVIKSITEPGIYSGLFPLETNQRWRRTAASLRNLSRFIARIKALEKRVGIDRDEQDPKNGA